MSNDVMPHWALPNPLRLLLIDDHRLILDGLSLSLRGLGVEVCLQHATHGQEAQRILAERRDFHLILLDLSLPDMPGLSFLSQLTQGDLFIPVAILSASEEPTDVAQALACGASGYISKAADGQQILDAIRAILAGQCYTPDFYRTPASTPRRAGEAPDPASGRINPAAITPRQMQVLELLAQGLPNKLICQHLGLTEDTVKTHLKALFSHLRVHNRTQCVAVATRLNLLRPN